MSTTPPPPVPPAGWYPDPLGLHDVRYWDGAVWTDHVADRSDRSGAGRSTLPTTPASEGSSVSISSDTCVGQPKTEPDAIAPTESTSSLSPEVGTDRSADRPARSASVSNPAVAQRSYSDAQARRDVERMVNKSRKGNGRISVVGRPSAGGGLACPNCSGTQFKARRSGAARAGIVGATVLTGGLAGPVVAAAVTKQTRVTCVTCGTVYLRG